MCVQTGRVHWVYVLFCIYPVCMCVFVSGSVLSALWDSMECSSSGASVHAVLQARILEWVTILFSRASSRLRDLPDSGIKPGSPALQADCLPPEPPGKALVGRILKMQRVQSPPGDQGRGGLILMVIFLCSTQPDPKISRGHGRF